MGKSVSTTIRASMVAAALGIALSVPTSPVSADTCTLENTSVECLTARLGEANRALVEFNTEKARIGKQMQKLSEENSTLRQELQSLKQSLQGDLSSVEKRLSIVEPLLSQINVGLQSAAILGSSCPVGWSPRATLLVGQVPGTGGVYFAANNNHYLIQADWKVAHPVVCTKN